MLVALAGQTAVWCMAPVSAQSQAAAPVQGIAAIVNDQVITFLDLERRILLAIISAGLRDTPDTRTRLGPQVIRTLVDESLELQEARRRNISATPADVENAKRIVESRNNIPRGEFSRFIAGQGMPEESIVAQMTAEIAWNKVVGAVLLPQINISDAEIDAELQRIAQSTGKYRYLISEIFLPAEAGQRDTELRAQAQRLADDIRGGASFAAVARQFSRGPSAFDAGNVGWVLEDQIAQELGPVVRSLEVGAVSNPVAAAGGYYLLQLRDRRTIGASDPLGASVHLKQVALPLAAAATAAEVAAAEARARSISATVRGCEAMDTMIREVGNPQSGDLGTLRLADLPERFRSALGGLEVGQASAPVRSDASVHVFMVCQRIAAVAEMPSRDEIGQTIGQQRLDQLERRFLRDLRRAATVDIRVR